MNDSNYHQAIHNLRMEQRKKKDAFIDPKGEEEEGGGRGGEEEEEEEKETNIIMVPTWMRCLSRFTLFKVFQA